jgi:hypothetical protein
MRHIIKLIGHLYIQGITFKEPNSALEHSRPRRAARGGHILYRF